MNIFKKHIVLLFLIVLHIPIVIQSIHIFECEKHVVSDSETEQHFHESENIDCSLFHYQFKMYSSDLKNTFIALPTHFYTFLYNEEPQIYGALHFSKQFNRGPPTSLVIL